MTTETKPRSALRNRSYPVPSLAPRGFRWKASAVCGLQRWRHGKRTPPPSTIVVPPFYNRLPAETVALGWLNEIDALHYIRQRMTAAARKTGWDVFTFHTQHNLDHFFDSAIATMRQTWWTEGCLSKDAVIEAKRRFGNIFDYYLIQPRLVENLVFQSSFIEWTSRRAQDVPLEFHLIGTALLSALVAWGSMTFDSALEVALKIGRRWDSILEVQVPDRGQRFDLVNRMTEGAGPISLSVSNKDLCHVVPPSRPFWFSAVANQEPVRITTAQDVEMALESLDLKSWAPGKVRVAGDAQSFRGWLVSPLHPMAKTCRWSTSNYLLATPSAVSKFLQGVAVMSRAPIVEMEPEIQNRFRLSRMKVTGP